MAIRITTDTSTGAVSSVRARASVTVVDHKVDVEYLVPAASVAYIELRTQLAAAAPVADMQYTAPVAGVAYDNLAVSGFVDTTGKFRYVVDISIEMVEELSVAFAKARSDAFGLSDITIRAISPKYSDSVSPLSDQPVFAVDKSLTDENPLDDALVYSFDKSLADATAELTDALTRSFDKSLADENPLDDALAHSFDKSLADATAELTDALTRSFDKSLADENPLDDALAHSFDKSLADATAELTDALTRSFDKSLADATPALDDSASSTVTKSLVDSVTMQDVLERYIVTIRAFSESVDATDDSSWEFTAGAEAEQIGVGDTFAPVFSKAVSDAFSMNDSSEAGDGSTYSFAKFINNVVFSGDNLASAVTKPLSDSFDSLDSGLVVAQSYCDITYFAEDYVGASAIF
jgi:hypothetical protein